MVLNIKNEVCVNFYNLELIYSWASFVMITMFDLIPFIFFFVLTVQRVGYVWEPMTRIPGNTAY